MAGIGKTRPPKAWLACQHVQLLKAALSQGQQARDALNQWRTTTQYRQYDAIDAPSSDLLPLVYNALAWAKLSDPWLPQLAGLHHYHWTNNAVRERRYLELFAGLQAASVKFVVLGSAALRAAGYYDNLGERPRLDARLVISPVDQAATWRTLNSLGWNRPPGTCPIAGWRNECWQAPEQFRLDVCYRWLPKEHPFVGIDHLLECSQRVTWGGIPLRVPDASHQLLHACIYHPAAASGDSAKMLWVADIMRVLQRAAKQIDWQRLHEYSAVWQAQHLLQAVLCWLRRELAPCAMEAWPIASQYVSIPEEAALDFSRIKRPSRGGRSGLNFMANSWKTYTIAEQTAQRVPSVSGWIRFWRWRISREMRRLVRFIPQKRALILAEETNAEFMPHTVDTMHDKSASARLKAG